MPESNSTINKDRIWPSFVTLYPLSRPKKRKRERERERERERGGGRKERWVACSGVYKKKFLLLIIVKSLILYYKLVLFVYSESEYTRIGQCVRPVVYTITLHNYIRLNWNFLHRIVSSISRSSSKMRRVRQERVEF